MFGPALCALLAAGLFAATAAESAPTWLDLRLETQELALGGLSGYQLSPATGMDGTIQKALVGVACALILLGLWLRPGEEREKVRQPHPSMRLMIMLALAPATSLAQSSLPPGAFAPDPAQCQAEIIALSADDARAAEKAFPLQPSYLNAPLDVATIPLDAQPAGTPADRETIAAITRLEVARAASLTSGRWQQHLLREIIFIGQSSSIGEPTHRGVGIPFVLVSDVQTFPGDRAETVVAWDVTPSASNLSLVHYHVYAWVDGAWRLAAVIPVS